MHSWKQLFFALSLSLLFGCDDRNNIPKQSQFVKLYGNDNETNAIEFAQTSDGGFLLVGDEYIEQESSEISKIVLVRTDRYGEQQWMNTISGESLNEEANDMLLLNDGNILILGTRIESTGDENMILYYVDAEGKALSHTLIDATTAKENGKKILRLRENNQFLIAGEYAASYQGNETTNITCVKVSISDSNVDTAPVIFKERNIGLYNMKDEVIDIIEGNNGDLVIVGNTQNINGSDESYIRTIKTNSIAFTQLTEEHKEDKESGRKEVAAGLVSSPSGYIVAGTKHEGLKKKNIIFRKLNQYTKPETGELAKVIESNVNEICTSIMKAMDGNYYLSGSTNPTGDENEDMLLMKVSESGQVLFRTTYGGSSGNDIAKKVIQLASGKIAILGNTAFGKNNMMTLIVADQQGNIDVVASEE